MSKSRAERERERWNEGLRRQGYERLLVEHSQYHFVEERRRRAGELLRGFEGADVLEIGSTTWFDWVERNNLRIPNLVCINISEAELEKGRSFSETTVNKPRFERQDANRIDFPDGSFDVIFGSGVLHHLDLRAALGEIARLLRPGGVMFFGEPLDVNPVGRIVRKLTPGARTPDERPFRIADLRILDEFFDCELHFEGMVSVPVGLAAALAGARVDNAATRAAYRADLLIARIPIVRYLCRHVFVEGRHR